MSSWVEQLLALDEATDRRRAMQSLPPDAPAHIHGAVLAALYSDLPRAVRLAEIGKEFAELRPGTNSEAFSARCDGHVAYASGQYERAVSAYATALRLFDQSGADLESARTLSSSLQALILLGRYDQAKSWAERAEEIFLKHGDVLRLARLDSNVGNIYFRLDKPREAIVRYERALEKFRTLGDAKDIAAALSNLAVCNTSLGRFTESLSCYERAREVCQKNDLSRLAAQADYNVAYLHYLRGDYLKARALYSALRERCNESGDVYHSALCDLDEAELDLELNLTSDGEMLGARAEKGFAGLGMRYERAKALVNLAVAASQRSNRRLADLTLRRAHKLFTDEGNRTWASMVDLLRAVIAFHDHRFRSAQRLSSSAWRVLATTPLPGRASYCQILLGRLWLRGGHARRALAVVRSALERPGADCSPSLRFHARLLEGEANELQGRRREALEAYEAARREIEDLRGRVDTEDLRISILEDKVAAYDSLVSMSLNSQGDGAPADALLLVQQAKSRSLADRLRDSFVPAKAAEGPQYETLRHDLNWCYRQIELAALLDRAGLPAGGTEDLRARARELESELPHVRVLPSLGSALKPAPTISYLQQHLPPESCLLEYFETRGVLYVFVLSRTEIEAVALGPSAPVRQMLKLLQFQMQKFSFRAAREIRPDIVHEADSGLLATNHHLQELYKLLIAPVLSRVAVYRHLIIAPHRYLHGLPFAALNDGEQSLIDRFTISTIPSASVYAGCRSRNRPAVHGSVVMAVPDPRAPQIEEEAGVIAEILPGARLVLGRDATTKALQDSSGLQILHLATHGIFRRDNPLFSSLQLADGRLNLIDLQGADLKVGLVTLSACHSGLSMTVGGDELLGLMRGFLAAGAQNLLVSLWAIHDASTKEFMRCFYARVVAGVPLPRALQEAIREVRTRYPHPFYWAPFILVGEAEV